MKNWENGALSILTEATYWSIYVDKRGQDYLAFALDTLSDNDPFFNDSHRASAETREGH